MISKEEIENRLWEGANELRGSMDASRYKDYMLGIMFYKFLSDKTLQSFAKISCSKLTGRDLYLQYQEKVNHYQKNGTTFKENPVLKVISQYQGFYIQPNYLFQSWEEDINNGVFELDKMKKSFDEFEHVIAFQTNKDDYEKLFSVIKLDDPALGSSLKVRNENITALINLFSGLNLQELQDNDIAGDVYEYLIGKFAMESGAKAGEFYTPHFVSRLIANIVSASVQHIKSIYDPTVGSGSLLLKIKDHLSEDEKKELRYYGQEKNTTTFNLCRMNLLLHGVKPEHMDIHNADTLAEDWPEDPKAPGNGILFDAVIMNPPYSLKNWNKAGLTSLDPRFDFLGGILPPGTKGDYAFLAHGLYHLNSNGAMGIVLPHGVLFRGGSEGELRKKLVDKNYIDAIIGLPSTMFTNTGIPVLVMILKKNRKTNDPIIFIDASNDFTKEAKQNILQEKHIAKITDAYLAKSEIANYCHLASRKEIIGNEYNLNIPRYVDSSRTNKFAEDVDAHLFGGLPLSDIRQLKLLNSIFPNFINDNFNEIRKGYISPKKEFTDLKTSILTSDVLLNKKDSLNSKINSFIKQYYDELSHWNTHNDLIKEKDVMLKEIKKLLSAYSFIDAYEGYQLVSELWKDFLVRDLPYIQEKGLYEAARFKVPNMVERGSGKNKHLEQDGFRSAIVPPELIESELMKDELEKIASLQKDLDSLNIKFNEIKSNNLSNSDDANSILSDYLIDDSEELDRKKIKDGLKFKSKDGMDYAILKELEDIYTKIAKKNKEIRIAQDELKKKIEEKIEHLTNNEIEFLMQKKWFDRIKSETENLLFKPINDELEELNSLIESYSLTLSDLDNEIQALNTEISSLISNLEKVYE